MNRHQRNDLAYYTFPALDAFPELIHAVTTRHGGVSSAQWTSLNLTKGTGDDPAAVEENLQRVCGALGLRREHLVSPNQRHTANVRRVGAADRGRIWPGYDTLITDEPGVPLLLRYADCTPVLIYDPAHHALALIHSGWRGTLQGAARVAVEALVAEYGSRPAEMIAAIGPSIGPCCYEVGEDVTTAVHATFDRPADLLLSRNGGRPRFDLWAANRRWLTEAGVGQIEVAAICTACRTDDFYSHRAEWGKTGHFGAVMMLRESTKDEGRATRHLRLWSFVFCRQEDHVETHELQSRIAAIQARIAAAARRAGRNPDEVTLVAVSKTHTAEEVAAAYAAGLRVFGENRVEEAAPKADEVARLVAPAAPPAWHMIGHLQSRKAEDVLPWASMVHSVDSVKLAQRLSRSVTSPPAPLSYQERGNSPLPSQGEPVLSASKEGWGVGDLPILLEVNVSGEISKYGFHPEELPAAVETIAALPGLAMQGLMTMAPITANPEEVRPIFAALRTLRDGLARRYPALDWRHLSMGMTDDFEVAIEEGATIVRVGRAIFGERT